MDEEVLANQVCGKDEGCDLEGEEKKKMTSKELYAELKENLKSIKESCGEICDTGKTGVPGTWGNSIFFWEKNFAYD